MTGPQLPGSERSVYLWTSTAGFRAQWAPGPQPGTFRAQWAPLDLNLGPSELSGHRWTSTWDLPSSVGTAGPQRPDRMPEDMPNRTPNRMSDRMPEDMPDKIQCKPTDRAPLWHSNRRAAQSPQAARETRSRLHCCGLYIFVLALLPMTCGFAATILQNRSERLPCLASSQWEARLEIMLTRIVLLYSWYYFW